MYFIANCKMFGGLNSLNSLHKVDRFLKNFKKNKFIKLIFCPPSTLIRPMSKKLINSHIEVGSQNCHENENYGAFTGFVNSKMLKNVGAKYVILGHSENRKCGETNKLINLKIKSALKTGLKVIFCIGETLKRKKEKLQTRFFPNKLSLVYKKLIKKRIF